MLGQQLSSRNHELIWYSSLPVCNEVGPHVYYAIYYSTVRPGEGDGGEQITPEQVDQLVVVDCAWVDTSFSLCHLADGTLSDYVGLLV